MTNISKEYLTIDYTLRSSWVNLKKLFNEQASKFGATMSSAFTLLSIDPKGGTPSSSLGPKMGIASTSLSRTLKELEEKELITRTINTKDRRSVTVELTDKGLEMRNIVKQYIIDFNNTIHTEIPQEKLEIFHEVIDKINKIAKKKQDLIQ